MASMMDEMAKTLARRRAQAEKKDVSIKLDIPTYKHNIAHHNNFDFFCNMQPEPEPDAKQRPWEKSNTLPHKLGGNSNGNGNGSSNKDSNSGSEWPRPMRKRFGSASEETILKVVRQRNFAFKRLYSYTFALAQQVNGDGLSLALSGSDLDALKADIVREIRCEIQKAKQEIIDGLFVVYAALNK